MMEPDSQWKTPEIIDKIIPKLENYIYTIMSILPVKN